jgi:hypothetical protein
VPPRHQPDWIRKRWGALPKTAAPAPKAPGKPPKVVGFVPPPEEVPIARPDSTEVFKKLEIDDGVPKKKGKR